MFAGIRDCSKNCCQSRGICAVWFWAADMAQEEYDGMTRRSLITLFEKLPGFRHLRGLEQNVELVRRELKELKSIVKILQQEQQRARYIAVDECLRHGLYLDPKYEHAARLNQCEFQVSSQNGEDGIIAEIFRRIPPGPRYFVEIGVGNGYENNTAFLLSTGWRGAWLEGDRQSVELIRRSFGRPLADGRLKLKCSMVDESNVNGLMEELVSPDDLDLLSIDVDGSDYWIWRALESRRPRVVVIEYNALFPPHVRWVQSRTATPGYNRSHFGASLLSLEELGRSKGYSLVGCNFTGVNAFFVRSDLLSAGNFAGPFDAAFHYEPARYYLKRRLGHEPAYVENEAPAGPSGSTSPASRASK